jgi:hypothetical protein
VDGTGDEEDADGLGSGASLSGRTMFRCSVTSDCPVPPSVMSS